MKHLLTALLITLSSTLIITPSAASEPPFGEEVIALADTRHRDLAGIFYDRTLEEKLAITGRLGSALERAAKVPTSRRIFFVDPMLIEEIQDLADGFSFAGEDGEEVVEVEASEVAINWLARFETLTESDPIAAINYGNPDLAFLTRAAPSELRIHHELSRQRLAELLSRDIADFSLRANSSVRLAPFLTERFTENRREIRAINRYARNPETRQYRLINASLLNATLERERAFQFARELRNELQKYRNSIRITSGRYTLTSANERVPITLINDFSNDLTVKFQILTSNSRVVVGALDEVVIPANSKLPVTIPVEVLSSGTSDLIITMKTTKGQQVGKEVRLPLTLAVISPLTTWITTGSGVILLLAAIVQSVRRVQRSRKKAREAAENE